MHCKIINVPNDPQFFVDFNIELFSLIIDLDQRYVW